jgi:hypothetical protein
MHTYRDPGREREPICSGAAMARNNYKGNGPLDGFGLISGGSSELSSLTLGDTYMRAKTSCIWRSASDPSRFVCRKWDPYGYPCAKTIGVGKIADRYACA